MLRADEQRAVVVERLGVTLDDAVADVNDDTLADGRALLLPFINDFREVQRCDAGIVSVQLA